MARMLTSEREQADSKPNPLLPEHHIPAAAHPLLQLQQNIGNQGIQQLLNPPSLRAIPSVNLAFNPLLFEAQKMLLDANLEADFDFIVRQLDENLKTEM